MRSAFPISHAFVALGSLLVLATGCLEPSEKLTEPQFNDIFHADTRVPAEVADGDVSETPDAPDEGDTADTSETPDVPDEGDTADTSEEIDTGDTGEVTADTEVAPDSEVTPDAEVTPETEVGPEVVEDCAVEPISATGTCLPTKRELFVFEPEHGPGDTALPFGLARAERSSGASGQARMGEPLEVALENGKLSDPTLLAYFAMENNRDNAVGGSEYDLSLGPDDVKVYGTSQAGLGMAAMVAPRFFGIITAPGPRAQTLMGWFNINAGGVAKTYDVIGYEADKAPTSELALGIEGGQWTALLSGTKTTFGAVTAGWQHVALSWDPDTAVAVLYLDGAVGAVVRPALSLVTTTFFVGAKFPMDQHDLGQPPQADDVVVFGRALPPWEVRGYVQMRRPFGAKLIAEAQPDYDDLRVVRTGGGPPAMLLREIIGRRPHSDSGAEVEHVIGVWPLSGDFTPSYVRDDFSGANTTMTISSEAGAFGDDGGAVRPAGPGPALIADKRPAWGPELTIEMWLRVATSEGARTCTSASFDDGATLMVAQSDAANLADGFALRLCDGKVELRTSAGGVLGTSNIADDRWHHVMASYDDKAQRVVIDGVLEGSVATSGVPSDNMLPIMLFHRPPGANQPVLTNMAMDDLVLHDAVMPIGYATNRVWPTLPHVRFLVDTGPTEDVGEGMVNPLAPIELRAGNVDVVAPAINTCGSLVSSCTGYVAWWRFESALGTTVLDISSNGLHLTAEGPLTWTRGLDGGLGLSFDGATQSLSREHTGELGLAQWSIEVGVRLAGAATDQLIVERPGTGAPPGEVSLNYGLGFDQTGMAEHHFRGLGGVGQNVSSSAAVTAGSWTSIGGSYDREANALSVLVDTNVTSNTTNAAPTPELADAPLFVGRGGGQDVRYFAGDLDALRIMSRPLLAAERQKYPALSWLAR